MDNKQTLIYQLICSTIILTSACIFEIIFKNFHVALALFILSYIIVGFNIIFKTLKNILKLNLFDENFLMCMATVGAFCLKEYFEAVIVFLLYQVGELLQHSAIHKSRHFISSLIELKPQSANLKLNNNIIKTDPKKIHINDIIIVKPGEKIPLDGIIISGYSQLNTAPMTGEAKPLDVGPHSVVVSGCINLTAAIEIKVTKPFKDCAVQQILNSIENLDQKKSKSEKFITKFSKIYTPIIVLVALAIFIIPSIFFAQNWRFWLHKSIILLTISCPCALVISVPLSFFGSIAKAAKQSILIKSSNILENLTHIKTIVFDKTGTLTYGDFEIIDIKPKNIDKEELIKLLVTAESLTNHPISNIIKSKYSKYINSANIIDSQEFAGFGVKVTTSEMSIVAGNSKLMEKFNIEYEKVETPETIIYIAKDNKYMGSVIISDSIRQDAAKTVADLYKLNIDKINMLTGDNEFAAKTISKKLNLDETFAKLLPHEKVDKIKEFQKSNPLVFVGDGINDAPALYAADIGIAMNKLGSDIAMDAADVILMNNNLSKIKDLILIARKTMMIVKQNIALSIGIKFLILASNLICPLNIWAAIFADVGVSTIAALNALRTLK